MRQDGWTLQIVQRQRRAFKITGFTWIVERSFAWLGAIVGLAKTRISRADVRTDDRYRCHAANAQSSGTMKFSNTFYNPVAGGSADPRRRAFSDCAGIALPDETERRRSCSKWRETASGAPAFPRKASANISPAPSKTFLSACGEQNMENLGNHLHRIINNTRRLLSSESGLAELTYVAFKIAAAALRQSTEETITANC